MNYIPKKSQRVGLKVSLPIAAIFLIVGTSVFLSGGGHTLPQAIGILKTGFLAFAIGATIWNLLMAGQSWLTSRSPWPSITWLAFPLGLYLLVLALHTLGSHCASIGTLWGPN